jgi:hypothetical protein
MLDIFEPPYAEWVEILKGNVATRERRDALLGTERITMIREQLIDRANACSTLISEAAQRCGVAVALQTRPSAPLKTPIVMAGHQPVVYHPGLLSKVEALARCADDTASFAINVVIDTDEGDAGTLTWPRVEKGAIEIKHASIATGSDGLYSEQRIESDSVVAAIFEMLEADLRLSASECGSSDISIERVRFVGSLYQRLSGELASVAHAVVRWALMGRAIYEVPLSTIVRDTAIKGVLEEFASNGAKIASIYNSTLETYRREHRIANPANPFPNMRSDGNHLELPMWRINQGRREPLLSNVVGVGLREDREYLAPRGSITTMVLRGFCSDLFIHGRGGATYDRFVDQLALKYIGVELPRFVVASRTRYLFPEKVAELTHSIDLASKLKEMTAKTESFLGRGIFTAEEEEKLVALSTERSALRNALQRATSPEERSAASHSLNVANRAVRSILETGSLRTHIEGSAAHQAALTRWSFREFPFFMYNRTKA